MNKKLNFKHSGRLGDIIYSLPLIKKIVESTGEMADLYIPSDVPSHLGGGVFHPGGELMVSRSLFSFISPLLEIQPYLNAVHFVESSMLPDEYFDLDRFKSSGLNLKAGLIQGWYRKSFGISFPIESPWLSIAESEQSGDVSFYKVLIGRTTRFCNTSINYSFLDEIDNVGFIGLDYEYEDFVKRYKLSNVEHVPVSDAVQMAHLMKRCEVYIGNQSLNFAIADGLKVNRALEVFEPVPNVVPIGGYCIDFINTAGLGYFLSELFKVPIEIGSDLSGDYFESIKMQNGYKPSFKEQLREIFGKKKSRF